MTETERAWHTVRSALETTGDRFAGLVLSAEDVSVRATRAWSIAETAAHVTAIAMVDVALVRPDPEGQEPAARVYSGLTSATVDTVSDLNEEALREYPERGQAALADRLRDTVRTLLAATDGADPTRTVEWLGGARVTYAGLLAHLLNELQIHGWDIARTSGTRWSMPPEETAPFFEQFFVAMVRAGMGKVLDTSSLEPHRRIAVGFRSAYTTPVTLVLDSTSLTAHSPDTRADVMVRFRPTVLNLMLFHRLNPARCALTGHVTVWGRRPWLLPSFLRVVHMPY
jgi:hypothetical protein